MKRPILTLETSPHVLSTRRVDTVMFHVVLALMPVTLFSVYAFGLSALLVLLTAVAACLLAEHLACVMSDRPTTVADGSALITGLLFGLTLPPGLALWMVVVGGFVCIGVGKLLFGGLGANPFNPALVGRAVLQAAFPVAMTTWTEVRADLRFVRWPEGLFAPPLTRPTLDAVTMATPLSRFKFDHQLTDVQDLALGWTSGSLGETSALLIAAGGLWLVAHRIMSWRIVVAVLAAVAMLSGGLHAWLPQVCPAPAFMLLSGGLMLGAVFMATDFVGSPMTHAGCWIYGFVIGVLVVVIRVWGGMPEGVMYAILLGNALTPLLDRLIRPRVYGVHGAKGGA